MFTVQNMLDAWQDLPFQDDVSVYPRLLLLISYDCTHNGNTPGKKIYDASLKIASRIIKTGKFRFSSLLRSNSSTYQPHVDALNENVSIIRK